MKLIRRMTAIGLSAAILLGFTGCDLWVPQSTLTNGETSDGVSGQVGNVFVANAVLIADGDRANLVVSLVNETWEPIRVTVGFGDPQVNKEVEAKKGGITQIGRHGGQLVILDHFTGKPGALYPVYFVYGDHTGVKLGVPVLTDAQPMYGDLGPGSVEGGGEKK